MHGQQVFIKHVSANQALVVATLKTQADGTTHIVPATTQPIPDNQPQQVVQQQVAQTQIIRQQPQAQQQTPQKFVLQQTTRTVQSPTVQTTVSTPITPQQQQAPVQSNQQVLSPATEQSLLQGQPPGTVIKCVTAEVTKNPNGQACIKLTGLQPNNFTQQQVSMLHQQVKEQLARRSRKIALAHLLYLLYTYILLID